MFELSAKQCLHVFGNLHRMDVLLGQFDAKDKFQMESMRDLIEETYELLEKLDLPVSSAAARRLVGASKNDFLDQSELQPAVKDIHDRVMDELDAKIWLHLDSEEVQFFDKPLDFFGDEIVTKLPALTEDMAEAGKCFAIGRYTASIFHLMRIMERCLQILATNLGVPAPEKNVWQIILNNINASIKTLDPKSPKTQKYQEISSHLFAVKLAWRNEVMHPKGTYTKEEAKEIFNHVRAFVRNLMVVI